METFYVQVEVSRKRVVKVQAETRIVAEDLAASVLLDDLEAAAFLEDEVRSTFVEASEWGDDDSIVSIANGYGYTFAEDDPAGRGYGVDLPTVTA